MKASFSETSFAPSELVKSQLAKSMDAFWLALEALALTARKFSVPMAMPALSSPLAPT